MNHGKIKVGDTHYDITSYERVYGTLRECNLRAENSVCLWHSDIIWAHSQKEMISKRDAAVAQIKTNARLMKSAVKNLI